MDKKSILLIDDDEYVRDLYKRQLEKAGFACNTAADGETGLAAIKQKSYDIVFLDILMPNKNGIDVLKALDLKEHNVPVVIVMLTNLGHDNIMEQAYALGAKGYIIKLNTNPYQFVEKVKELLEKK